MKRSLAFTLLLLVSAACAAVRNHHGANPYEEPPFYAKYLNTGSQLDADINSTIDALRANPASAKLHNELGAMLVQKSFPKDAAVEFQRAIDADSKFYPAWYNLGLVRSSLGDDSGAQAALEKTVHLKPGHAQALFQLGLNAEQNGDIEKAVDYYAKAYSHYPRLMDVRTNPRIVDTKLVHLALLKMYGRTQARQSMTFQGPPAGYTEPTPDAMAAPVAPVAPPPAPVAPAAPVSVAPDPATQTST
jgi:tetratricopeptide (TPR) repeat protein